MFYLLLGSRKVFSTATTKGFAEIEVHPQRIKTTNK
jgi:hypothetical protein